MDKENYVLTFDEGGIADRSYYPNGAWCKKHDMWCKNVVYLTILEPYCTGNCKRCKESEER